MPSELSAAEANRLFYEEQAAFHDETEYHLAQAAEQEKLRAAMTQALALAGSDPSVLDAGGGTGNASSKLLEHGVNPLVVDISPDMLELWDEKARALGHEPQTQLSAIEDFLATDGRSWDLIIFSSVLHHLEDPTNTLLAAAAKLNPGGVVVTFYDPTPVGRGGRMLRKFDWVAWETLRNPRRVAGFAANRLRRLRPESDPRLEVGRRAERYAQTGLDDKQIAERVHAAGFEIVAHRRIYDARFGLTRLVFRILRHPSSFSFTIRRPPAAASE